MPPQPTERKNSKTRRCLLHDYRDACIYLLTVTVEGRQPLLGKVAGDVYTAHIELTELGKAVRYEINMLPKHYPQVQIIQYMVMPDHVHLILRVKERLPETFPLGNIVAAWKHACGKAFAAMSAPSCDLKAATPDGGQVASVAIADMVSSRPSGKEAFRSPSYRRLFSEGFNDSILTGKGQLQHMIAYVRDNPRRLLLKRQYSPFFTIRRGITVVGQTFDAVGNMALLQRPLLAVHCRRRWTEGEQQSYRSHCLAAVESGTVLIGAFISKAEQAIAREVQGRRLPLIHLMENGFEDLYKPVGKAFYATAEGHLLQLAPWPYHVAKTAISREQCVALNGMAEAIAAGGRIYAT